MVYLEDEEHVIEIDGIRIKLYGSPWTAVHGNKGKAFQIAPGNLQEKWAKIPDDVDILVTHSPPFGVLDKDSEGEQAGCRDLLETVTGRVRPRVHVFGHIHASSGLSVIGLESGHSLTVTGLFSYYFLQGRLYT